MPRENKFITVGVTLILHIYLVFDVTANTQTIHLALIGDNPQVCFSSIINVQHSAKWSSAKEFNSCSESACNNHSSFMSIRKSSSQEASEQKKRK